MLPHARRRRQESSPSFNRAIRSVLVEKLEERRLFSTVAVLTRDGQLFTVDSTDPRTVLSAAPITGLQSGEKLLGIDMRPATGELYGLGSAGDLYTLNPTTAAATLKATLAADPADVTSPFTALAGTDFGIDFDPIADRLRIVSEADQNLLVNPTTGQVITETTLTYDAGDQSSAANPSLVDIAYTNSGAPGATTSTLLGLEGLGTDLHALKVLPDGSTAPALSLVRVGGPNGTPSPDEGHLFTVGPYGRNGVFARGLDLAPDNTTFVGAELHFLSGSGTAYELVMINPDTGVDTALGHIGDGATPVEDIAVVQSVQFSAPLYAVNEGDGSATITVTRTGSTAGTNSVNFTTRNGTASAGIDYGTSVGTLTFGPGETSKTFAVPIVDDDVAEGDDTVNLFLSDPSGNAFMGGSGLATLRINASDLNDQIAPKILSVSETGASRGISGMVIRFNEDVDPTRAETLANYTLRGTGKKRTAITFSSATYDPVGRLVKLTASQPFSQTDFKRLDLRVASGGATGIADVSGNALDGNGNGRGGDAATFTFNIITGKSIKFTDTDGDVATLFLNGPGRIDAIQDARTKRFQAWILDPIALQTSVSGTVKRSPTGNGIVVIAEIIGLDKKEATPLLTNTSFRLSALTFSPIAKGV